MKNCNIQILALFIFVLNLGAKAQDNVGFEAYCDAKEVLMDSYFEVTFTLKNANGTNFTAPDFEHFTIIAGPSSSTSMQIVNGQVTREMGYSFSLQPKKIGTLSIESASIQANGKLFKTRPLSVKVIKGNSSAKGETSKQEEAYVIIEPSKVEAYLGEQILLDFKLYTSVSLDGYDITSEPDYRGFYVQELKRYNSRTQREVIDGQQMTTKILRRLALFPQQTGQLIIPSARIQLAVIEDNDRRGFFFSRNVRPLYLVTDPVAIQVNEFPGVRPASFTGAVGNYEFQASVNRKLATTDDAISVTMLIGGNGDPKRVQPPPLLLSDSFEVYPPKIIEENLAENNGQLYGRKILEYLVLAKYPGNYVIEPSFGFFNTLSDSFSVVTSGPFPLKIGQGSDRHISQQNTFPKEPISNDIRYIKMETELKEKEKYFINAPIFWAFNSIPFITFISLFFLKKIKNKNTHKDLVFLKRKQANSIAQKHLASANGYLQSSSNRDFYNEISKASLGYVSDKLNISLSELSKENVKEELDLSNINQELIDEFMDIIYTSEKALFAGMDNTYDMQIIYKKALKVISNIEEEFEEKNDGK